MNRFYKCFDFCGKRKLRYLVNCLSLSFLYLIFISSNIFATDTLPSIDMDMSLNGNDLAIDGICWAENNIIYGVRTQSETDSQIYILDFNKLDTNEQKYIFPEVIGTLKRTGESDTIVFHKRGSMMFYGDSNCLRVCDVSDLKNPVYIDSIICGIAPIKNLTFKNDTIFVGESVPLDKHPGIHVLTYKNNKFTLVDSLMIGGGEQDFYWSGKCMSFYSGDIYIWNLPVTKMKYDYKFTSPTRFGTYMIMHENFVFIATEVGIIVYNLTSEMEFIPQDTLPAIGIRTMRIYRNLLLAGGSQMHLFDISKLNDIKYVAVYIYGGDSFFADSVSKYLYVMHNLSSPSINRINIEKYVDETPIKETKRLSTDIGQYSISYSPLNHTLNFYNQFHNASISIVDPCGKLVQKYVNISQGRQVLKLNKNMRSGMYYAVGDGQAKANCKIMITK